MLPRIERRLSFDTIVVPLILNKSAISPRNSLLVTITTGYTTQTMAGTKLHPF